MQKHLVIIGTVWPEPNSTAAGSRMLQLIDLFQKEKYKISFLSSAKQSEFSFPLESQHIDCYSIELNQDSSEGAGDTGRMKDVLVLLKNEPSMAEALGA